MAKGQTLLERFLSKVCFDENGHWMWMGNVDGNGYGLLFVASPRIMRGAHRIAYELFVGPIADGLQIDHLCRVPLCVNPGHLEAVLPRENKLRGIGWAGVNTRKTHCPQGHILTEGNLCISQLKRGRRICRACTQARDRKRWKQRTRGLQ